MHHNPPRTARFIKNIQTLINNKRSGAKSRQAGVLAPDRIELNRNLNTSKYDNRQDHSSHFPRSKTDIRKQLNDLHKIYNYLKL